MGGGLGEEHLVLLIRDLMGLKHPQLSQGERLGES